MVSLKVIVSLLAAVSILSSALFAEKIVVHKKDILKKVIKVEGMTCVGCEVSLENALKGVKGVLKVKASSQTDTADIEFDKTKTNMQEIKKVISKKGYDPE